MSASHPFSEPWRATDVFAVLVRCVLAGVFIYTGLNKALHPVEFLKLMRQYDLFHDHLALNLIASALPWFEVFCGLLLALGIGVRGAAFLLLTMLMPFSALVLWRALAIHEASGLSFCGIKFDCGCGAGEVLICQKLVENIFLALASTSLIFAPGNRCALRHRIL